MGAFKDGEGNFFFAWFSSKGAVVRGFDHESAMSPFCKKPAAPWPGILEGLPASLSYAASEPAFALEELTFACWSTGGVWRAGKVKPPRGSDPDGAARLLGCFARNFHSWAEKYYEMKLADDGIDEVWFGRPLDEAALRALNPEYDKKVVRAEAKLLGWKLALDGKAVPARSFGEAEFVVRCEPTRVSLLVDGKSVASSKLDLYEELFDLVKARLRGKS
jgi:hypothetical protein